MLAAVIFCLSPFGSAAQTGGDIQVDPTRIVFEGRERTAEITLINGGSSPSTYRISFKNLRMRPDGSFEEILAPTAADMPAQDLVRFAPRQVKIEPGQSQTVRLAVRKPADLPAGEYRSHLLFTAVPGPGSTSGPAVAAGPGVYLQSSIALSIPIIVRHGQLAATAALGAPRLERNRSGQPVASIDIYRRGNQSLFGDIEVVEAGTGRIIGVTRGVAVYTNTDRRSVHVPLTERATGTLKIRYRLPEKAGGAILAEAILPLGG